MPPKSIFRQPGAKRFQLVHRSQRDPLIHDPEAGQHVLKPISKKPAKSRAQLDESEEDRSNAGEAALYGIYFDDTEYDYMQHLRPIGVQEEGVESFLIEAPSSTRSRGITLKDLPPEVLPSTSELPRTYEEQQDIPDSIAGFQPDMDPHLRQVLEALEDDAFLDAQLEDDFFTELVVDGQRTAQDNVQFEFHEYETADVQPDDDDSWERRFARFKREQVAEPTDSDDETEGKDTVSALPSIAVIGGKKRRKGTSDASGYSMSSSSMYRNEALQTLDERFDELMLSQYNEDQDSADSEEDDDDDDEPPQLITSRPDFSQIMDEFLDDYELLGGKLQPKLAGDSGAQKLETLRRAMGQDERVMIDDEKEDVLVLDVIENREDRWDCETILTTYSNLENRPRVIRARDATKIHLDSRTGLPSMVKVTSGEEVPADSERPQQTISRPRDESPESKKARKATVKAERAARRAVKKSTKDAFAYEFRTLTKSKIARDLERGVRKL